MRKTYKKILCLCAVLVFCLTLIPVSALAQDPFTGIAIGGLGGLSGAGLFGSMASATGVDIAYTSDPVNDAMWNKLNPDSVYFSGEKHEASNIGEDIYDYINVDIGDWLNAQSDFIVNFITTNNIQDNDTGSVISPNSFNGIPLYKFINNRYFSDFLDTQVLPTQYDTPVTFLYDGIKVTVVRPLNTSSYTITFYYNDVIISSYTINAGMRLGKTYNLVLGQGGGTEVFIKIVDSDYNNSSQSGQIGTITNSSNINYTSNTINENIFDGYNSAKVKIPSGSLSTGWTVEDFLEKINDLWLNGEEDTIIIENGGETPVPPTPIPTTPLGDVPSDEWMDFYGQHVIDNQEALNETVNDIPGLINNTNDTLDNIDQNIEDSTETLESIDTNIGVGNGILGGIRTIINNIASDISSIKQGVLDLINEIVLASENLIAGILNQIPVVFGVIFTPFKQASSIWHYVVEWVQSISAPFSWIRTVATGTSYYIILPVYASLAGTVVLAFFKRFGR